jgi:hypothetical protein
MKLIKLQTLVSQKIPTRDFFYKSLSNKELLFVFLNTNFQQWKSKTQFINKQRMQLDIFPKKTYKCTISKL